MSGRATAEIVADLREWIEDDEDDPSVANDIALLREVVALLGPLDHDATCECCHDDEGRYIGWEE